ncbi:MAG: hypothetical protein AAFO69_12220 [Bacteroidota bacterium]
MKTSNILLVITLTTILIILPAMLFAQGAPPKTPIDGGLSLLLAAGGIYGVKKLRDSKRK